VCLVHAFSFFGGGNKVQIEENEEKLKKESKKVTKLLFFLKLSHLSKPVRLVEQLS